MNANDVIEVVGDVMRDRFAELEQEIRRTDRASALVAAIEAARMDASIKDLRAWVHAVAYQRSRVVTVRSAPPEWLARLDEKELP